MNKIAKNYKEYEFQNIKVMGQKLMEAIKNMEEG